MSKLAWRLFEKILHNPNTIFTLDQLSQMYSVTPRSIRNYVKKINIEYPNLIKITNARVSLNTNIGHDIELPKFDETRHSILFKDLINNNKIDYFAFTEREFIEPSTLEKDLQYLRNFLKPFEIEIRKEGPYIALTGKEVQIRKATSALIKSELNRDIYDISVLMSAYPDIDVEMLNSSISKAAKTHDLRINIFARFDVLLHLCVFLSSTNDMIEPINVEEQTSSCPINDFINDLGDDLYNLFGININENEKKYLSFIFESRLSRVVHVNDKVDETYINPELIEIIDDILLKTSNKFYVDLSDTSFKIRLNLHIQGLVDRVKKEQEIRNPMTQNLKNQYPLVYEVAVYIASELQTVLNIVINDNEISFFALHIGSLLTQIKDDSDRVDCLLVCPSYNNLQTEFRKKIEELFNQKLRIIGSVDESDVHQYIDSKILIISVIPMLHIRNIIYVSPFLNNNDIIKVEEALAEIKQKEKEDILKSSFLQILNPKFYQNEIYLEDKEAYIHYMVDRLKQENIVSDSFLESTLERERISSTAFNNIIAIPHPMELSATRTTISIIMNRKPILWDSSSVHIIMLMALNKKDIEQFYEVFDSIIDMFSGIEDIEIITKAKDYNDFIHRMISQF